LKGFSEDVLNSAVEDRYSKLAVKSQGLGCGPALELVDLRPGEVVVDLGCGKGKDALAAAKAVGASGHVYGVDGSEAMIAAAGEQAQGLDQLTLLRAPLHDTGLPAGLADAVISNCAINHALAKDAVYREIYRLLKKGGRFVVSDIIAESTLPQEVREDPAAWAACYGGALTLAENETAMRSAGFERLHILEKSEPYWKEGIYLRKLTISSIK